MTKPDLARKSPVLRGVAVATPRVQNVMKRSTGKRLGRRDGLGITESGEIEIATAIGCQLLVIEVSL
jgi:hypothetical protein